MLIENNMHSNCPPPRWNSSGVLPPGEHPLTISQVLASILVHGDNTSDCWDSDWRKTLVGNLRHLATHLFHVGISEVFADGSFCSNKDRPGDIDGYFVTDFPKWSAQKQQLLTMDPAWDLNLRFPDSEGKPKPLMWHKYHVELFPVFREPFASISAQGGNPPVTIDRFFRQSRDAHPRGIVRLVPEGSQP
jgi:hypothetical protein